MDKVYLRGQLLKHKQFLESLYKGQNLLKTINHSTDEQLHLLLKVIHLIGDGQINVDLKHQKSIKNAKREQKLEEIGGRVIFRDLMKKDRAEKLKIVKQFKSLYPILLHKLFNK